MVWFGLLGTLQVRIDDRELHVPAKQRVLLAALLLTPGQAVSAARMSELVWDGRPPSRAAVTLRSYVKRLRQVLGPSGRARIITTSNGYEIDAADDEIDIAQFDLQLRLGIAAGQSGAWQRAASLLDQAAALWRGSPLADIPCQALQLAEVPRLEEQRLQAIQWRIEAGLHLGKHDRVMPDLQSLTAEHPLHEPFHGQLMVALYRSGRQADALAAYRTARGILVSEIGVEPGPELQLLHERILASDRELLTAAGPEAASVSGQAPAPVRQLPPAVAQFAGRAAELKELDGLSGSTAGTVLALLDGTAGVGKTALALHWGHQVAGSFPDGQLFLNLNGFGPAGGPMTSAEAVSRVLQALQVPAARMPASFEGRVALYRSLLADRRMLIVLDNARDAEQVRPLLAGGAGCMVLVTSRFRLTGLVVLEGARSLTLSVLTWAEARQLVARRLGAESAAADPQATDQLIGACARLPLALAIATALIATRPGQSIDSVSRELTQAADSLDVLDAGEAAANLRAVFTWSYDGLTQSAARMFCLLAEHPGPEISTAAAASLAGTTVARARAALLELGRANLLSEQGGGRFAFHDLLRQYAAGQLSARHTSAERLAAGERMLDHYLHSATSAALAITPQRNITDLQPPATGTQPEHIASQDEAFAWFQAEHPVLMRVIAYAADAGADVHAWRLPLAMTDFHDRHGYWHDWAACQRLALAAAERLGDISAQSNAHRYIGRASFLIQQHDDALDHLTRALELRHQIGPPAAEAGIHLDLCRLHEHRGTPQKALDSAWRALDLYQAARQPVGVAFALDAVGLYHALLSRYPEALHYCERALKLATETGYKAAQAQAFESLGFIHLHMDRSDQAISCYQRSLEIYRELGDRYLVTTILSQLGDAHHAAGDPGAASQAWLEALAILEDLDHPDADDVRAKLAGPATRH
jgi:DNA-binding SARP family transcriptional activator